MEVENVGTDTCSGTCCK